MSIPYTSVVGIDLGTTYSSIGRFDNKGQVNLFQDTVGLMSQWIPSVVSYPKKDGNNSGEVKVGHLAMKDERRYPQDVIYDAKRMLGRKYTDEVIKEFSKKWLFKIKPSSNGGILVETSHGDKTPVEICSEIIKYLLNLASDQSGNKRITHAVVSVPANYSSRQREETKQAALKAGLEEVHLIGEPTAGIISYWFSDCSEIESLEGSKKVLTFDFGGGTLDLSLAEVTSTKIDIVAVTGRMSLGGRDIDNNLVDYYLRKKGLKNLEKNLRDNSKKGERSRHYMRLIRDECEKAKIDFSTIDSTSIDPQINLDSYDDDDPELTITKETFNEINGDIIRNLMNPVDDILKEAKEKGKSITKNNLDDIILIGGSSNNIFVATKILDYFHIRPIKSDPRNAVVKGAAIDAKRRYSDNGEFTELEELSCQEICPLSLGTSCIGDRMDVIIPKNSKVPISNVHGYITTSNYSNHMIHEIYETERLLATEEGFIGSIEQNLPEDQAGQVKIRLQLSLDEDGILKAKAWVLDYDNPYYTSEKIIRDHLPDITNKPTKPNPNDDKIVQQRRLQQSWIALHRNVLSFIKNVRCKVRNQEIKESFKKIEDIAYEEKDKEISSEWEYNYMIDTYTREFQLYNFSVSDNQKTKFLNYYGKNE